MKQQRVSSLLFQIFLSINICITDQYIDILKFYDDCINLHLSDGHHQIDNRVEKQRKTEK